VSTIAMTLNTLPSLQHQRPNRRHDNDTDNATAAAAADDDDDDEDGDNKYLSMIEAVCVCWMAAEYVVRLWASPLRYAYCMSTAWTENVTPIL